MCNLNIVPNKTGSVLGMLSKFFNTTACISSCMCAPVCVKGSISPSRSSHVAPLLSGCQPMVSSLPSIARRVTPLPVVTSTSDPLLPDYAQFSPSALPFSLSGSIPRLMQGNMLQADRQGRGWHTRAHTHSHKRHVQPTWVRYWAGSEAHGTPRLCRMWQWRSRCVVKVCLCLCNGLCWVTKVSTCVLFCLWPPSL